MICFINFLVLSSPACPVGQFKWGTEGQCRVCPGFSHATIRGASVCACHAGYLRSESDAPNTPCTGKRASALIHMQRQSSTSMHSLVFPFYLPLHFFTLFCHLCCCHPFPLVSFSQTHLVYLCFHCLTAGHWNAFLCDRLLIGGGG